MLRCADVGDSLERVDTAFKTLPYSISAGSKYILGVEDPLHASFRESTPPATFRPSRLFIACDMGLYEAPGLLGSVVGNPDGGNASTLNGLEAALRADWPTEASVFINATILEDRYASTTAIAAKEPGSD